MYTLCPASGTSFKDSCRHGLNATHRYPHSHSVQTPLYTHGHHSFSFNLLGKIKQNKKYCGTERPLRLLWASVHKANNTPRLEELLKLTERTQQLRTLTREGLLLQRVSTLSRLQFSQLQTKSETVINIKMFAFSGLHKTKLHEAKTPISLHSD